jgi:hypothetical protein
VAASVVTNVGQAESVTTRELALEGVQTVLHQTSITVVLLGSGKLEDGPDPQQYDGGLALRV